MFCGPESVDVPEAKPTKTSKIEGPQSILLSRGLSRQSMSILLYTNYQESKKRKNKANCIRKYIKYFLNFVKNIKFNSVHSVHAIHKNSRFSAVQRSRVLVMAHYFPRALMRGRQSNFLSLT